MSQRRLAAVLAADMAGFSRLMEADENQTLRRQKQHRRELIDPAIAAARGNIIKTTGDGLIVEFASAQDAVHCAIEIQTGMNSREAKSRNMDRIQYRVGINVGDIIFDDGDIFGEGVNVAARLETLSEPGGVCVSDPVYQMIRSAIAEPFVDLGAQNVKNISRPIKVWQWTPNGRGAEIEIPEHAATQSISFCFAQDGAQLAWAGVGNGPAVLKARTG
jgi:class 3 adenylate cyclase